MRYRYDNLAYTSKSSVNEMNRAVCLGSLVLAMLCVFSCALESSGNSIFLSCDKDSNGRLTMSELEHCLGHEGDSDIHINHRRSNPSTIMHLMDTDHDGEVSFQEFLTVVENVKKSGAGGKKQTVEVVDRYGQKKTYTTEELLQKMEDSPQGLKQDGDRLIRESEGTSTIAELAHSHPLVSNVVTLARWGLMQMINNGVVSNRSVLLRVHTLSSGEDGDGLTTSAENALQTDRVLRTRLELVIGEKSQSEENSSDFKKGSKNKKKTKKNSGSGNGQRETHFEMEIVRDRRQFVRPHLNMEALWRLGPSKERLERIAGFPTGQQRRLWSLESFLSRVLDDAFTFYSGIIEKILARGLPNYIACKSAASTETEMKIESEL